MEEENSIKLSPGIFLNFILESTTPQDRENSQELTIFLDLIKIFYPDALVGVNYDSISASLSGFKQCRTNFTYWAPLNKDPFIQSTKDKFEQNYVSTLKSMNEFCDKYFSNQASLIKHKMLIQRTLALIEKDNSIRDDALFTIFSNQRKTSKAEMLNLTQFEFQPFILGIWCYLIINKINNNEGSFTYERHFSRTSKHEKATFIQNSLNENDYGPITIKIISNEHSIYSSKSNIPVSNNNPHVQLYIDKIYDKYSKTKTIIYGDYEREFYSFYVCNDIINKNEYNFKPTTIDKYSGTKTRIKNASISDLTKISSVAIITGTGGLGKSMMMRHFTLKSIEEGLVPIFVPLRMISESFLDLENLTYEVFTTFSPKIPFNDFISLLESGNVVFLLDGYDEIKSKHLESFENALELFVEKFSNCTFFMSSRPKKSFTSLARFREFPLMPLTQEQSIELIQKLEFDETIKQEFIRFIEINNYLKDDKFESFINNPLLLTIMLITYDYKKDVMLNECNFYENAFDAMLERHDLTKKGYNREYRCKIPKEDFKDLFAEFCCNLYENEIFEFSKTEVNEIFNDIKENHNLPSSFSLNNFLHDLSHNLCLLVEEGFTYSFSHRSFQEYFTAWHYAKQNDDYFINHIYPIYKINTQRAITDSTLNFLNLLAPNKVERNLIVPFLKDAFNDREDISFWEFMKHIYPTIDVTIGNSDRGLLMTSCNVPIARLIFSKLNDNSRVEVNYLFDEFDEIPEEFIIESYHRVISSYDMYGTPEYSIISSSQLRQEDEHYEDVTLSAYEYSIDVESLLNTKDLKLLEIKNKFETDKDCEFKTKYSIFTKYYKKILNK